MFYCEASGVGIELKIVDIVGFIFGKLAAGECLNPVSFRLIICKVVEACSIFCKDCSGT